MKQQIETAQDAGVPDEHRVGIEGSSLPRPATCGGDPAVGARRPGGESLPSVLATMRAFRLSVAVLDS